VQQRGFFSKTDLHIFNRQNRERLLPYYKNIKNIFLFWWIKSGTFFRRKIVNKNRRILKILSLRQKLIILSENKF